MLDGFLALPTPQHLIFFFFAVEAFDGLRIWSTFSFRMEQHYRNSEQAQLMLSGFLQMGTVVLNATNMTGDARHGWAGWEQHLTEMLLHVSRFDYLIIFKQAVVDMCQLCSCFGEGKRGESFLVTLGLALILLCNPLRCLMCCGLEIPKKRSCWPSPVGEVEEMRPELSRISNREAVVVGGEQVRTHTLSCWFQLLRSKNHSALYS